MKSTADAKIAVLCGDGQKLIPGVGKLKVSLYTGGDTSGDTGGDTEVKTKKDAQIVVLCSDRKELIPGTGILRVSLRGDAPSPVVEPEVVPQIPRTYTVIVYKASSLKKDDLHDALSALFKAKDLPTISLGEIKLTVSYKRSLAYSITFQDEERARAALTFVETGGVKKRVYPVDLLEN